MSLLILLPPFLLLAEVEVLLSLGLGRAGFAVPPLSLVVVLITARHGPPGRYRVVALSVGLLAGALLEGGLLLAPAILLAVAALASTTRLLKPARGLWGPLWTGIFFALLHAILLALFSLRGPLTTLEEGGISWAATGLLMGGMLLAAGEALVARAPRLRHLLERP